MRNDRTPAGWTIATTQALATALAALAALAGGCASTTLDTTWKDPAAAGTRSFSKVFVVAIVPEEPVKRVVEDELVRRLAPTPASQAYTVLARDEARDRAKAQAKVKAEGFDGALVVRLVDVNREQRYVGGAYPAPYYSFWGYWDYAYPIVYSPGYITTDTIVRFETNLYSVADGKLLWSGLSRTFNPSSAQELGRDLAKAVVEELRDVGLLSEAGK